MQPSSQERREVARLGMSISVALLCVFPMSTQSKAESLVGGYYACLSKDLLHEINVAKGSQKEWLLENGCIVTRGGVDVHDLGFDGFAIRKIRIILDDGTPVLLWTPMENVR